ncbi:beta-N-acetylhexosaminidase [bacterium]|nr:beta-N-acetylhexosaminidase [bacterium]
MKKIFFLLAIIVSTTKAQDLLPQPKSINTSKGAFTISKNTLIRLSLSSPELNKYVQRFVQRFQNRSGVFLNTTQLQDTLSAHEILIQTETFVDTIKLGSDESYKLEVNQNKIIITANNNIGAYRGLETLLQLIQRTGKTAYVKSCMISDSPRFPWRGLLIDVCRHWIPTHVIKRNIDAMAAVKMNVLHMHLTEDQGFRIESKKFPKLHKLGSNGNYFTQEEMKGIVKYAKERGIRVIPEFDIPGHTTSWLVGYPELSSANADYQIEKNYGIFNPSLNPAKESTYSFLDEFLGEMALIFPDEYIHIGGDENKGIDWDKNKKIQKFKDKNSYTSNSELQAYFNTRVLDILTKHGKKMIGWDEVFEESLPVSVAIQSWRGKESLYSFAKKGYAGLLSNGYYLDMANDLKVYYENNPLPLNADLTQTEKELIYGGEATMWSELVNEKTIDSRIWPATLAVAERLWSSNENCNTNAFYNKVGAISNQLEEHGLIHLTNQTILLKQLSNQSDVNKFQPFVQLLEPLKGYERHRFLKYTTHYPLNRLVDACYTESFRANDFETLVSQNCKTGICKNRDEIKTTLATWIKAAEQFVKVGNQSQGLMEAKLLALKVQELCELAWRSVNSPSELKELDKDRAQVLLLEIENFKLDVKFAPIQTMKRLFN